jgi:hypothetical protein
MRPEKQLRPETAIAFLLALAISCWGVAIAIAWVIFQATHGAGQ